MKRLVALAAAFCAVSLFPATANAAFGEDFGVAPINVAGAQSAAAIPGEKAFWAGTCDRASAPAFAAPIPGGFGARRPKILKPSGNTTAFALVKDDAPVVAPHCIDWGAEAPYPYPTSGAPDPFVPSLWLPRNPAAGPIDPDVPNGLPAWRLAPVTQAGAHPDATAMFHFARNVESDTNFKGYVDGAVDNIVAELPVGFVGDPASVPKCSEDQFKVHPLECPPESQVGVLNVRTETPPATGSNLGNTDSGVHPVYNLEPRQGKLAEFGVAYLSNERATTARIVAKARTNGDFGVTTFVSQIPAVLPLISQQITLWGVPWAESNDIWRAPAATDRIPPQGYGPGGGVSYSPSWGPIKPFISNPTECSELELNTRLLLDSYENQAAFTPEGFPVSLDPNWKDADAAADPVTACEKPPFTPGVSLQPDSTVADSATGLAVDLSLPQNDDPPAAIETDPDDATGAPAHWRLDAGLGASHLKDTVVTLPEGLTLNPSAAHGLAACTTSQIGLLGTAFPMPAPIHFDDSDPSDGKGLDCPQASKVAEVVVETPVLEPADWPTGEVYIAAQNDNPFNSTYAIYIAVRSPDRGLIAKLAGVVEPNPTTGQLKTTFANGPQVPFERFRLRFKQGPRAPLATPTTCGAHATKTSLTPWSAAHGAGGVTDTITDPFQTASSAAGGCPATKGQRPLNLGFSAWSHSSQAGAHSPFTVNLTRPDGNQEIDRVQVRAPEGLAASLAGVSYCSEASIAEAISRTAAGDGAKEIANPSCPPASQLGTTTVGAGAGADPFYVSGRVYLAGPYKGAPLSLAFVVPAVAGPFDLGVQVVRAAVNVDPKTAQITTVSDPIPQILAGVPLRIRDIRVDIDRPGFTLNPTDCSEQALSARVFGASGAVADLSNRFQVGNCEALGFKPKLTLRLRGGTVRGRYPALTATLTARPGDANIARASVALPRSEFLANEHIRTVCTRGQFAASQCPAGAIYGFATAWSPLLDEPLRGPVYLRSSDNLLPDLVPDLRGPAHQPIRIELAGRTDSFNDGIRNTFDVVPDAPVSRFVLRLKGGNKGLLKNSRDICRRAYRAVAEFDAQNGRQITLRPKLRADCKGKKGMGGGNNRRGEGR